jgi:Flp pilus assembly protein TadG
MKKFKKNEDGQSTVEFALVLPVIVLFMLMIVQVGIVVRQKILVTNSSREAARILSVENNSGRATDKVKEMISDADVKISRPSKQGEYLTVTVSDVVPSNLPIIGNILPDVTVKSKTSMRVEK